MEQTNGRIWIRVIFMDPGSKINLEPDPEHFFNCRSKFQYRLQKQKKLPMNACNLSNIHFHHYKEQYKKVIT